MTTTPSPTPAQPDDVALALRVYRHLTNYAEACSSRRENIEKVRDEAFAALTQQSAEGALRPEVLAFAHLMEAQLRANDHKSGWQGCDPYWLHERLLEEADELKDAQKWKSDDGPVEGGHARAIGREAADVANFAMMIADVQGALSGVTLKPLAAAAA